jgi:LysR family transcriptional regulator, glycine cleavage system transcriptional activator
MLDLESLTCVDALARTLSFHRAARACALSPAAFGKRVRQVEEHLTTPLFFRTTRRVELTPEGAQLLPAIRRLLSDAMALTHDARSEEPPVDLVLGTRHELGMSWLFPARRALHAALPHLTVHLAFGVSDALEAGVLSLRIDAAVLSRPPATTRLDALPLHREDYALVACPRLLRERPLRRAADAAAHTLIDADAALPLFRYLHPAHELRFARTLLLGTIDAIRAGVLEREGVAVLPRYFVEDDLAAGRLTRVLPRTPLAHDLFRLIFRSDDPRRALLERVAEVLQGLPLH